MKYLYTNALLVFRLLYQDCDTRFFIPLHLCNDIISYLGSYVFGLPAGHASSEYSTPRERLGRQGVGLILLLGSS